MSTEEVCRLCLSKESLVWVFDKRFDRNDHMKDVIFITTGVEIHPKDVVSQKICTKCMQDAIKLFEFRQESVKTDKYLREQCREALKTTEMKIPNTDVTIKTERIEEDEIKQPPPRSKPPTPKSNPPYRVHPTIISLFKKYPEMHLPSICLLSHVDPVISLEMDAVEDYFKNNKLDMQKYARAALRACTPKRTPATRKPSESNSSSSKETDTVNNDSAMPSTSTAQPEISGHTEPSNKVPPLNIKINQTGYTIVKLPNSVDGNSHGGADIQEETQPREKLSETRSKSLEEDSDEDLGRKPKKRRRLSDIDFLSHPETKKSLSTQFPDIRPGVRLKPSDEPTSIVSYKDKSMTLFQCTICSSIHYSAKHLKAHQQRHLWCQFCKLKLKSVEMKQQHINSSCLVKEAMNKLPQVAVEKVEINLDVRRKYPEAFSAFSPIAGLVQIDSANKSTAGCDDVIEIMSDEEDARVPPKCAAAGKSEAPPKSEPTVIKPDITIKNDRVMDTLNTKAPHLDLLKQLLTKYKKLQLLADGASQTEFPSNESIEVCRANYSAELKNLKHLLHTYKIPVVVEHGPLNASYNYQPVPRREKKLKLWNDSNPIDVKTPNIPISNQVSVIAEVTANRSSSGDNIGSLVNLGKSPGPSCADQTTSKNVAGIAASFSDTTRHSDPVPHSALSSQINLPVVAVSSHNIVPSYGHPVPSRIEPPTIASKVTESIFSVNQTPAHSNAITTSVPFFGDSHVNGQLPNQVNYPKTAPRNERISPVLSQINPNLSATGVAQKKATLAVRRNSCAERVTSENDTTITPINLVLSDANSVPRVDPSSIRMSRQELLDKAIDDAINSVPCVEPSSNRMTRQELLDRAIDDTINSRLHPNTNNSFSLPCATATAVRKEGYNSTVRQQQATTIANTYSAHNGTAQQHFSAGQQFANTNYIDNTAVTGSSNYSGVSGSPSMPPVSTYYPSRHIPPPPYPNSSTPNVQGTQSYVSPYVRSSVSETSSNYAFKVPQFPSSMGYTDRYIDFLKNLNRTPPADCGNQVKTAGTFVPANQNGSALEALLQFDNVRPVGNRAQGRAFGTPVTIAPNVSSPEVLRRGPAFRDASNNRRLGHNYPSVGNSFVNAKVTVNPVHQNYVPDRYPAPATSSEHYVPCSTQSVTSNSEGNRAFPIIRVRNVRDLR
ncbi:hypothetical protein JTB14_030985 [Gonioctena quinquepunctata]|nr:hypothetical protein JTB14_030985 [Gonioctena quinquepunctata]